MVLKLHGGKEELRLSSWRSCRRFLVGADAIQARPESGVRNRPAMIV